tara:strand:- start:1360 stop:1572 length:213 start_codon:yes stop_codon:yes gene_type:complete
MKEEKFIWNNTKVCEPISEPFKEGSKNYLVITENYGGYCLAMFMDNKWYSDFRCTISDKVIYWAEIPKVK